MIYPRIGHSPALSACLESGDYHLPDGVPIGACDRCRESVWLLPWGVQRKPVPGPTVVIGGVAYPSLGFAVMPCYARAIYRRPVVCEVCAKAS